MPEKIEETIATEAKVVAETAVKPSETPAPVVTDTPVKKKKNPVLAILLIILGLIVLCCAVGAGGFYYLYNSVQNGPQATALKTLYTSLSEEKANDAKAVADTQLFADLYRENTSGESLADQFVGNVVKVVITNVSVENNSAKIEYTMIVARNQDLFSNLNYAELRKVGDQWIVTYIGDKADQAVTPTPTEAFDYDF